MSFDPKVRASWSEVGIAIVGDRVGTQNGSRNASHKTLYDREALLPKVVDVGLFIAHFGNEAAEGMLNGSGSWIPAQAIWRKAIVGKWSDEDALVAMYNRLRGIRTGGGTRTIVVIVLPDGSKFSGTDGANYRRAFANAMERQGITRELALQMAAAVRLPEGLSEVEESDEDAGRDEE